MVKDGIVYHLTDKGRAIAQFEEVNHIWNRIKTKLGGYMSLVGYAEEFEKETGIKMQKNLSEKRVFYVAEMVMDESLVLGMTFQKYLQGKYFTNFEEIKIEDLILCTKEYEWQDKIYKRQVFSHPDLSYYLSPYYLGAVIRCIERSLNGTAKLLAIKEKQQPFLVKVITLKEKYEGPAFFIAPTVFER